MMALAVLGIVVNGLAAFKLKAGANLNERILSWHLLEDVLGWLAVLLVSVTLMFADWPILDPLLAVGFTLFVLFNVIRNTAQAGRLFFQAAPDRDMIEEIHKRLTELASVESVHHEHAWSLDGEQHVYSAHLRLATALDAEEYIALKRKVAEILRDYNFAHTTIELEYSAEECRHEELPL